MKGKKVNIKMKCIFLDHDGVICLEKEWGSRIKKQKRGGKNEVDEKFDNFNSECVKILNEIIEKTGIEIIVSSDWRKYVNLNEMCSYYKEQGIIKQPIGMTDEDATAESIEGKRIKEIQEWIKEKGGGITKYLVIDDMDLSGEGLNFMRTRVREGLKQTGLKDKIIKYFE